MWAFRNVEIDTKTVNIHRAISIAIPKVKIHLNICGWESVHYQFSTIFKATREL